MSITEDQIARICAQVFQQMSNLQPPKIGKFVAFDSSKETFAIYIKRFENYCARNKLDDSTDKNKTERAKLLLDSLSTETYNLLTSLVAPDQVSEKSYDQIEAVLTKHLDPPVNIFLQQHKFLNTVQRSGEEIKDYVARLKTQAILCEFYCPHPSCKKSIADSFMNAQFIRGIQDAEIREKLIELGSDAKVVVNFEKVVAHALSLETTKVSNKEMSKTSAKSQQPTTGAASQNQINESEFVNAVKHRSRSKSRFNQFSQGNQQRGRTPFPRAPNRSQSRNRQQFRDKSQSRQAFYRSIGVDGLCFHCGRDNHPTSKCRISRNSLKCNSCGKLGHVEKVCMNTLNKNKSSENRRDSNSNKQVAHVEIDRRDRDLGCGFDDCFELNRVSCLNLISADRKYCVSVQIGHSRRLQRFEVDSGSKYTLLPQRQFTELQTKGTLKPSEVKLSSYTHDSFKVIGVITVGVFYRDKYSCLDLYVVPDVFAPVLGRDWIRALGISLQEIDRENSQDSHETMEIRSIAVESVVAEVFAKYSEQFERKVGRIPNVKVDYILNKCAKPLFLKARPVPQAIKAKVEKEYERMEAEDIMTKIDHSEWGSPAVIVPKTDGDVRICVDYKTTVNQQLADSHYPLPTIEGVLQELRNGKIFCILDIYKAYLHIPVTAESAKIQTLTTHKGIFQINRLSQGIKTAPNEFHKVMDQILGGLDGTVAYFDDIVVFGESIEQCRSRLFACMDRLKSNDLHLNRDKCVFFQSQIKYLGHVIEDGYIKKSKEKIDAIVNAPKPDSPEDVKRFLGLIAYYSKFIPNASSITEPLRRLLCSNVRFHWSQKCEAAFKSLKEEIASDRVLVAFNPELPVSVACDAGPHGISGVLSHIVNGVEKPVAFASRSLTDAEKNYSQLDKEAVAIYWSIRKFFYYIYGRKFTLITDNKALYHIFKQDAQMPAITSSRLLRYAVYLGGFNYVIQHRKSEMNANADYLSRAPLPEKPTTPDEDDTLNEAAVLNITSNSITAEDIAEATNEDPELKQLKDDLLSGKNLDSQFSLFNGIVLRGSRVVIPGKYRAKILDELHETHPGIVRMKGLARRYVYWKNIDVEIESLVKSCRACAEVKKDPRKAPLHKWDEPEENFQRIHIDYAGPRNNMYFLVVVDSKSKWPEVAVSSSSPTSQSTIKALEAIFTRNGLPEVLVSDNATIFTSFEFTEFCKQNGIAQKFSPPGHPATNGLAERYVQILKRKLDSMEDETGSIDAKVQKILYYFRATPLKSGKSPAENYLGRKLRTRLDMIRPSKAKESEAEQSENRQLPPVASFSVGERVQVRVYQQSQNWRFGRIRKRLGNVTYVVELDDGYVLKRHFNQLRSSEVGLFQKSVAQAPKRVQFELPLPPRAPERRRRVPQVVCGPPRRSQRIRQPPVRYGNPVQY